MSVPVCLVILFMRFLCKVNMPNLVTYLNQKPIFEWYEVRRGSRDGFQKGTWFRKRLDLCVQNKITI